jgi:cytochrome c oxidase cbb3-type subunit 2
MDRGMVVFLGCLLTFTSSWLGLVLAPLFQINKQEQFVDEQAGAAAGYPRPLGGSAARGMRIFQANGCMYCHSQQVRAEGFGNNADIQRGWGTRRNVPRDYMYDNPVMLGTMRTGPDLANVGVRGYYADWHHKHLYNPRMMVPGSIMPPFKFLYEKRKIVGEPSADALILTGDWAADVEPGYEIVPTGDAKDLVAYLLSLDRTTVALPEAKE